MGIFGLFSLNAQAQQDATIDPSEIHYWIGEGVNEVVFIVNWNEPDTALAWGYRFNEETVTVETVMDAIAEADSRFSYDGASGWLNDIFYNDGVLDLSLAGAYWMYNVNAGMADLYTIQTVANGDYIKWGDESCGFFIDPVNWIYGWEKEIAAVYPLAFDAKIDPSEILYWVGQGENEVVFAVNWAEPNICYAWGFRFSTESVLVKDVMDAIAEADDRFSYVVGGWGVEDIKYDTPDLQMALVGMYWMYNINGMMAGLGYDQQPVVAGDFIKWGDESCGTEIAPWTLVWETPVQPVPNNTSVSESNLNASLQPNPATSYTMLNCPAGSVVTVCDVQGRILSTSVVGHNMESLRIETAGFEAGLYFVTINDGAARQTLKLMVR